MVWVQVGWEDCVDFSRLDPRGLKLGYQVALGTTTEHPNCAGIGIGGTDSGVDQDCLSLGAYQVAFEVNP